MNDTSQPMTPAGSWPWQRITIGAGIVALLVAAAWGALAYAGKPELKGEPVTEPHPIATTTPLSPQAFMGLELIGESAIVYDLTTGSALYAKSADRQLPLASVTKLLSAYETPVSVSTSALAAEGESGLFPGESFAFSDLARYSLAASSNDAAEAIAETVAARQGTGVREALAGAAAAAGLSNTYANNGSGLDVDLQVSGGYGTARDVAILAGAIVEEAPELAEATTHSSVSITSSTGIPHSLPNTNQGAITVPGILLSKTGFTDLAGGNLVVVFDAGIGHPVAAVVLGSTREGRFSDVTKLIKATRQYFTGIPSTAGNGAAAAGSTGSAFPR
jgi:D-alanyl-D-alanine carboxypeptidase/D-alanyl-D-alanine carboxypeptidase (penicillin-binding protein 5/6)